MNTNRLVFSWAVAALALGAVPAARAQAPPKAAPAKTEAPPKAAPAKTELTIFTLKYLQAEEAQQVLTELLGLEGGKGPTRIVADPRINSLIVSATAEEITKIEALLVRLDRAVAEGRGGKEMVTEVYRLRNLPADKDLLAELQLILPPDARIAADARTNAIILHADESTHRAVARLLGEIARPVSAVADGNVQVRIVWLVSGKGPIGSAPPADFGEVVAKLEKLGVKDPKMLAQFVVPAGPDGKFTITGLAKLAQAWSLSSQGVLSTKDGRMSLSVLLQATVAESGRSPPKSLCELETTITYSPGQTVLLGVTPTEDLTSVFALQLIAEAPKGKGRR
jgi:hypothetical protein